MKLSEDAGPIHSTSNLDRPGQRESVIDYADRGRRRESMRLLLSHKIAPGVTEPGDMEAQQSAMGYDQRRQSPQRMSPFGVGTQGRAGNQQRVSQRTPAQKAAYWVGIIVWIVFILFSLLLRLVR